MLEQVLQRHAIGSAPDQLPFAWPFPHPHAQADLVVGQVTQHPMQRAYLLELAEDQPDDRLHLFVRVEANLAVRRESKPIWPSDAQT
jgi:hypothetical protein